MKYQLFTEDARPSRLASLASLCGVIAFGLFFYTLAPTIGWGDSADLAMRMVSDSDQTFVNSSRDYPLYRWIGSFFQLLPWGDVGARANLMTAFFGAVSVGLASFLAGYVAGSRLAGLAAGIALTFSHTFWFLSVTAEVYTFNLALVFCAFVALTIAARATSKVALFVAAVCAGLALNHHPSGLILIVALAPLALLIVDRTRLIFWVVASACFFAASWPYWIGVADRFLAGNTLLRVFALGSPANPFYDVAPARETMKFIAYAGYNFAGVAGLLALYGFWITVRKRHVLLLPAVVWAFLFIGAGVFSSIPDKFNIYVLVYPTVAILSGVGLSALRNRYKLRQGVIAGILASLAVVPISTYAATVQLTRWLGVDIVGARVAPYRDNSAYFLWPPKNNDFGPRRYAEEALSLLPENAILIADYTLWRPLLFVQTVDGLRRDIDLVFVERLLRGGVDNYIAERPRERPVYLATNTPPEYYQLKRVLERYQIVQRGVVYEVVR